jgi:hypothetical protein
MNKVLHQACLSEGDEMTNAMNMNHPIQRIGGSISGAEKWRGSARL